MCEESGVEKVIVPELESLHALSIALQAPRVNQGHTVDPCGTERTFAKLQWQRRSITGDIIDTVILAIVVEARTVHRVHAYQRYLAIQDQPTLLSEQEYR